MEEDQRIAHSMFGYAKMVNDLRAVDEQERARRTSLDYTSSPVVHNSVLSAAFQVPDSPIPRWPVVVTPSHPPPPAQCPCGV
jgi:hypothetical protein